MSPRMVPALSRSSVSCEETRSEVKLPYYLHVTFTNNCMVALLLLVVPSNLDITKTGCK